MAVEYTPQQRQAIFTHDRNLLVSAAAGSGKTAVLAERCVALIEDKNHPCDADQLLVLTYTNAAAAEMRQRITQLLSARAVATGDARLQKQVLLLAGAQISTLHSFCTTMVRRYFHELGIDPAFRLMEEDETSLMMADVAEALIEQRLADDDGTFGKLVEQYAGGSPERIAEVVLRLYFKQSSLPDPARWLKERRAWLEEATTLPLRNSRLGKQLIAILVNRISTLAGAADRLVATLRTQPGYAKYAEYVAFFGATAAGWGAAFNTEEFDHVAAAIQEFGAKPPRLPTLKPAPADKEIWQARVGNVAAGIKNFARDGILRFSEAALKSHLASTRWAVDALTELVDAFRANFAQAKHDAGLLDFNDLERFAQRLLISEDSQPTAIALTYRQQFRHVLIDEYQDVNELQDTLLKMLANEDAGNLFTVGDIKQSIYRFRQADPERFKQRYLRYKKVQGSGEVIDLQQNFRSRGPLLESLNSIFERLMMPETSEVRYNASQRLIPGAKYPQEPGLFAGAPIELHIVEKDAGTANSELEADEREAVFVAARLRQLLGYAGEPAARVAERDGSTRAAQPGDVAILLRAMRIKAERFATVLRNAGIPVQADSTTGFFAAIEVQDVLAALRAINNQRSDYDVAGYLRSPLCGLKRPEDALAEVRLHYPHAAFHEAVQWYVREQSGEFAVEIGWGMARLDRWAIFAQQHSVAELIRLLLDETSYSVFVAGLADGAQRSANLAELLDRARSFERFRRPTLSRFLRYIETVQDQGDLGMPPADGQARNAVRIMSVHKSKGLEFPIVVVPDLGKEHNLRDSGGLILVDETAGLALKVVDAEREVNFPSMASMIAGENIRRKSLAEEMRVLYVATTRAREHLILVGTAALGSFDEWDAEWSGHTGALPAGAVLAGRSMLDWIGPAAALAEMDRPGQYDRHEHAADEIESLAKTLLQSAQPDVTSGAVQRRQPIAVKAPPSSFVQAAIDRLTFEYSHTSATLTPATISVTDLVKTGQTAPGGESVSKRGVVRFERLLRPPRFLTAGEPLSAADAGAVTHAVLQRLDFARPCDEADLKGQIAGMVQRGFIREADAAHIDLAAILWFLETELGQRFRAAPKNLLRELDVVYAVPAPNTDDPADRVMVRGRLDAALVDDAGLTLVDYKTDRVTPATVAARAAFYQPQIDAYRTQLSRLSRQPVNEAYLVFLTARVLQRA